MKKLTKLFTVLFVIIAMFACVSTVLADEPKIIDVDYERETDYDPSLVEEIIPEESTTVEQEEVEAAKTEEQQLESEELDVPKGEIEQTVPEDVRKEDDVKVITDAEKVFVEEELIGENKEEVVDTDYSWFSKTVTIEENQADILLTLHPALGQEIEKVEATATDIARWFYFVKENPVDGAVEVKQVVDDEGNGTGEWLVITNEVTYELHYDRVFGKYYYNALRSDVEGEYDIIYIDVNTQRMNLEGNEIQNHNGSLRLQEKDINIAEGMEDVVIFDGDDIKNYVEGYKKAYEGGENLTIDNIKAIVVGLEDADAEGVVAKYDPETGKVTVSGIEAGKYVVYLEGYYTEETYDYERTINRNYSERKIRKGTVKYEDDVDKANGIKVKYNKNTKEIYRLEANSAWSTFAKFNVEVFGGVSSVDGNPDDDVREWVVAEEITPENRKERREQRREEREYEAEGFEGVEFYNIDAYQQETDKPAKQVSETEAPVTIELKVEDCEKVSGYTPKFTVYHYEEVPTRHGTRTIKEEITDTKTIYKDGAYYVVFEASEFSKYSVAWNYKKNPKTSYEFVNTGVDGYQQQVNVAGLVTMCAFALLVALKKKVSHC